MAFSGKNIGIEVDPFPGISVVDDVMAAGAEGFVLKRRAAIDLIPAIREVLQDRKYISPEINGAS